MCMCVLHTHIIWARRSYTKQKELAWCTQRYYRKEFVFYVQSVHRLTKKIYLLLLIYADNNCFVSLVT